MCTPSSCCVEIHCYQIDNDISLSDPSLLSSQDRQELATINSPTIARQLVWRRSVVRRLLGKKVGVAPEKIALLSGPHGKPYLRGHDIPFNTSYSQGVLVIAVASDEKISLGIDVEYVPSNLSSGKIARLNRVALEFYSGEEQVLLSRIDENDYDKWVSEFYRLWTRKEALVKAWGESVGSHGVFTSPHRKMVWSHREWYVEDQLLQSKEGSWRLALAADRQFIPKMLMGTVSLEIN